MSEPALNLSPDVQALIASYDPAKYNILLPLTLVVGQNQYYKPVIGRHEIQDLDRENSREIHPVYAMDSDKNNGVPPIGWAPKKPILNKFASLAGVTWEYSKRVPAMEGEVTYESCGVMTIANGKQIREIAEATEKLKTRKGYDAKFVWERAQSRSKNRVLRSLLSLLPHYSWEDIQKPFVILRFEFVPPDTPETRLLLTAGFMAAQGMLQGADRVIAAVLGPAQNQMLGLEPSPDMAELPAAAEPLQLVGPSEPLPSTSQPESPKPTVPVSLQPQDPADQVQAWRTQLNDLTAQYRVSGGTVRAKCQAAGLSLDLATWTEADFGRACELIREASVTPF